LHFALPYSATTFNLIKYWCSGTSHILKRYTKRHSSLQNNSHNFMNLIQKSEDFKKDADVVIGKTKINELLANLGKV